MRELVRLKEASPQLPYAASIVEMPDGERKLSLVIAGRTFLFELNSKCCLSYLNGHTCSANRAVTAGEQLLDFEMMICPVQAAIIEARRAAREASAKPALPDQELSDGA